MCAFGAQDFLADEARVSPRSSGRPFAPSQTFEYLFAMANEIAIVDGEDLKKRAVALRRFL